MAMGAIQAGFIPFQDLDFSNGLAPTVAQVATR
jgi:hypothetical protein